MVDVKIMFLVNPAASSVTPRTRVVIQKALAADHEVVLAETIRRDHATRLAKQAVEEKFDVVVVLGRRDVKRSCQRTYPFTNRSCGSSVDLLTFCKDTWTSDDPVEATGILLETMDKANPKSVGLVALMDDIFVPCWNGL